MCIDDTAAAPRSTHLDLDALGADQADRLRAALAAATYTADAVTDLLGAQTPAWSIRWWRRGCWRGRVMRCERWSTCGRTATTTTTGGWSAT